MYMQSRRDQTYPIFAISGLNDDNAVGNSGLTQADDSLIETSSGVHVQVFAASLIPANGGEGSAQGILEIVDSHCSKRSKRLPDVTDKKVSGGRGKF